MHGNAELAIIPQTTDAKPNGRPATALGIGATSLPQQLSDDRVSRLEGLVAVQETRIAQLEACLSQISTLQKAAAAKGEKLIQAAKTRNPLAILSALAEL